MLIFKYARRKKIINILGATKIKIRLKIDSRNIIEWFESNDVMIIDKGL